MICTNIRPFNRFVCIGSYECNIDPFSIEIMLFTFISHINLCEQVDEKFEVLLHFFLTYITQLIQLIYLTNDDN